MLAYKEPKIKEYRRSAGLCLGGLDATGTDLNFGPWSSNVSYINASGMKPQKHGTGNKAWNTFLLEVPLFSLELKEKMPFFTSPSPPPPPPRPNYKHVICL